jgi:hypothetical protein
MKQLLIHWQNVTTRMLSTRATSLRNAPEALPSPAVLTQSPVTRRVFLLTMAEAPTIERVFKD